MTTRKTLSCTDIHGRPASLLTCLFLCLLLPQTRAAVSASSTNEDYSVIGNAVVELLQSRDAARFANGLAPSTEDWRAIVPTNPPNDNQDALKIFLKSNDRQRANLQSSARHVLEKADALHLDFSTGALHLQVVAPRYSGTVHFNNLQAENKTLPWVEKLEIIITPEHAMSNTASGDFKLMVNQLIKFPGGWRLNGGVQWSSFPANVADEKARREMAIMEKAASHIGITEQDDPALLKLGETLVRFVRNRDVNLYAEEALITADMASDEIQKQSGQKLPRAGFDKMWNSRQPELLKSAHSVVTQMDDAGIDLKRADIQVTHASVQQLNDRTGSGNLDGLEGSRFEAQFTVKSDGKSKTGQPLSGDYILAADPVERVGDDWRIMSQVHWKQFPAGVLDDKAAAALVFDNYVAEHGTLPPGTAAPDIEFTRLDNGQKMKLSDLHGKVVVLDFWATWCGPCQEPMAKSQTFRQMHPDWKDRVALVPLSIDDTLQQVRDHVQKHGWTNTFNVWAGDGGWKSAPVMTYRVKGVPTCYIIDAQGKIFNAGHPAVLPIADNVDYLLKPANP